MNNQFSENLRKIRKENNLSQEQLADELGVSRQAISKWESGAAYPEMEKIITLCDKFHVNIDNLLYKDIKEVNREEESKKNINHMIQEFLKFITDSIHLFSNLTFIGKIKCLLEQCIYVFILFLISTCLFQLLNGVFDSILQYLPYRIHSFSISLLNSTMILFFILLSIIILVHIFKTRYLDYYISYKNNEKHESFPLKEKENKIIIRDSSHSEYKFISILFKCILGIFKLFLGFVGLFFILIMIGFIILFVFSFLIYKTGFFFIGILTVSISSISILLILLLLILNFIFNRAIDKKKSIYSFLISLVVLGLGLGMIMIGSLSFEVLDNNELILKKEERVFDMRDDLIIYPYSDYGIHYVESDNTNIRVEYLMNHNCSLEESIIDNTIRVWPRCDNPFIIVKDFIQNMNHKTIIPFSEEIEKITVYTNSTNIEILKKNWEKYIFQSQRINEERIDLE